MSQALADGVVSIVKAACGPLIEEIKILRAEVAALKGTRATNKSADDSEPLDAVAEAIEQVTAPLHTRIAAIEKALGIKSS